MTMPDPDAVAAGEKQPPKPMLDQMWESIRKDACAQRDHLRTPQGLKP